MKRYNPTTAELKHIWRSLEYRSGAVYWKKKIPHSVCQIGDKTGYLATGYRRIKIQGKIYYEHNIIWFLETGRWPLHDMVIDHIDRNKLNNDISNLREITKSNNAKNHSIYSTNSSGTTGVHYDKTRDRWIVSWFEDKKLKRKSFACKKYSDAKALAKAYRKRKVMVHY